MKHCKQCGQENKDQKFCVNCGAKLDDSSQPQGNAGGKQPKKPMTKKQKLAAVVASGVAILFIALYFIGAHFTSHERLVKNFEAAVNDEDAKKLAKTLNFQDVDEKIGAADVKGFLEYLKENPDEAGSMIESLHEQSGLISGKGKQTSNKEELMEMFFPSGEAALVMIEEGNGFLFFDTYKLTVEPAYVTLKTNVEGTKLYAGEKEIAEAESEDYAYEYGPLVPGLHTFQAVSETDFIDLSKEEEIAVMSAEKDVDLSLDATYIGFDVPFEGELDSRVVYNDETIDFNIFDEEGFGPIALDESSSIAVEIDFPWGTMTSLEHPLDRREIPVSFEVDKKLQKSLEEALQDHVDLYLASWQKNDITKLGHLSDSLQETYQYEIESDNESAENGYGYDKQVFSMFLDTDNVQIDFTEGDYYLSTIIKEDGATGFYDKYDDSDREESKANYEYSYTFLYDKKSWVVYDKNTSYSDLISPAELAVSSDLVTLGSAKTSKTASAEVSSESNNDADSDEAEEVTLDYVYQMVEAINDNDYELVAPYIKSGSDFEKTQTELVDHLNDSEMTQEVIAASVTDVKEKDGKWIVNTDETIKLIYESGEEETEDYQWEYTVEKDGDSLVLSGIE